MCESGRAFVDGFAGVCVPPKHENHSIMSQRLISEIESTPREATEQGSMAVAGVCWQIVSGSGVCLIRVLTIHIFDVGDRCHVIFPGEGIS